MELALSHYAAMGAVFRQDPAVALANGRLAAERTQNAHVRTLLRALNATGALDMWDCLARVPGLVGRSIQGGQLVIRRTGPKDARVEFIGYPFFCVPYMHHSIHGTYEGAFSLVARRTFVRQDPSFKSDSTMALIASWV